MESNSNQKSVQQIQIFFEILQSSHPLPWWQLCTLLAFSTSFIGECFSISLKGVPTHAEHLLAAFPSLCGPTHPKPSQLGWDWVIVEARSSDAALHHSPSWSNSPYTAWRCVLSHYPVGKQMIVPLSPNQMEWRITAECCGSHAG